MVLSSPFIIHVEANGDAFCSSGDTGVSASLVFHGTPPFTVYYHTQRNKEPVKELSRIYTTSRGELTLQPPHSGHYTYTFTSLSDAYYKSVPLNGPSIDQVVHPLAAASFVNAVGSGAKRLINSCSGNLVDVEVELLVSNRLEAPSSMLIYPFLCDHQGNGPWNLEFQAVGPKSSDILYFPGISESRKTLQIPIPADIDKDGGSFEVVIGTSLPVDLSLVQFAHVPQ
jgi:nucleoporin POM152